MLNKNFLLMFLGLFISITSLEGTVTPNGNAKPIHEAFVTPFSEPRQPTLIPRQPPAPINEEIPPQPSQDFVWIPGYWAWFNNDFVWICGVWRNPPPNQSWIVGSWTNQGNGWAWAQGFWSATPIENIQLIKKAPPLSVNDQAPSSPGKDHFWIPGYWQYSSSSNDYTWLSGKWAPLNESWILTPAAYVWRPSGYIFAPLYWDWPLDQRGNAYTCEANGPVVIEPQVIIQDLFLYYPNYITLYCYFWYFYPDWWDGCGCVPSWWWWTDWWAFGWGDMWGLWWWWAHPGFLPPFWLTLELSLEIAPPPVMIIDAFKHVPQPDFPYHPGNESLRPQGTPGITDVPKPDIPNEVTPGGQVTPPHIPEGNGPMVTPPSPPSPRQPITPPSTYPTTPSYPPQQIYPPQNTQPPIYPPRTPQYPQAPRPNYPTVPPATPYPPTQPQSPKPNYPTVPPRTSTPPATHYPTTPNQPTSPRTPPIQPPQRITPPTTTFPQTTPKPRNNLKQIY